MFKRTRAPSIFASDRLRRSQPQRLHATILPSSGPIVPQASRKSSSLWTDTCRFFTLRLWCKQEDKIQNALKIHDVSSSLVPPFTIYFCQGHCQVKMQGTGLEPLFCLWQATSSSWLPVPWTWNANPSVRLNGICVFFFRSYWLRLYSHSILLIKIVKDSVPSELLNIQNQTYLESTTCNYKSHTLYSLNAFVQNDFLAGVQQRAGKTFQRHTTDFSRDSDDVTLRFRGCCCTLGSLHKLHILFALRRHIG